MEEASTAVCAAVVQSRQTNDGNNPDDKGRISLRCAVKLNVETQEIRTNGVVVVSGALVAEIRTSTPEISDKCLVKIRMANSHSCSKCLFDIRNKDMFKTIT